MCASFPYIVAVQQLSLLDCLAMNFYKSAALALDHLEKNQGSVKGSLSAAGVQASGGEAKRILASELSDRQTRLLC